MKKLKLLPFDIDLNRIDILKQLNEANNSIGELKGVMNLLPNPGVILSLLAIGESRDSSAIENIITTYEDIYREMVTKKNISKEAKEVNNYKKAMDLGFKELKQKGFISTNMLVQIQKIIEPSKGDIRKIPGTVIMNANTGEVVHNPPQNEEEIRQLLHNLEIYVNEYNEYDPLIQLALIHFQFESIHPFYDGNGRTGRILNILYLVLQKKINQPILYLSKYIIEHKQEYYELLRLCNADISNLPKFVLFILKGINETSQYTINLVMHINKLIQMTKAEMNTRLREIYSEEIVIHLFSYLYTKNEFFRESLNISRPTATKYLKLLVQEGFLISERIGKEVVYKNVQLINIFK